MSKFESFCLIGEAFKVRAVVNCAGEPEYWVSFISPYGVSMTPEQFKAFKEGVKKDADWDGMMNSLHFNEFEETWKGGKKCTTEEW